MGIQERKERERRKRAGEILEAARRSFELKGFLNTTLQDVADEAEVSVGLIYRYFQSKEDIFASLALKGAEHFDEQLAEVIDEANQTSPSPPAEDVLVKIAERFLDFYGPYGEYFDLLMFSYRGMNKKVQIRGFTLTKLMSVSLFSMDRLKDYLLQSGQFKVQDEEEALQLTFLFWAMILGCHKIFDGSGRGHILAFSQPEFTRKIVRQLLEGAGKKAE